MRYNPCGRVVEMMRRPYKIPCRFLRDSDVTSTLKWVEARDDALPLDKVSIISSEDWDNDRGLYPDRIGEQDGRRVFEAADAPPGSGRGHVCGTDEDFDLGGTYDPDLPPVQYDALGYPRCCAGAVRVRGGLGVSGRSAVTIRRPLSYGGSAVSGRSVVTPVTPISVYGGSAVSGRSVVTPVTPISVYGGSAVSGRSVVTPVTPISVYGGSAVSGRSTVGIGPPCLNVFGRCEPITSDEIDHWCWWEENTRLSGWRRWSVAPGETYRLEVLVVTDDGEGWHLYEGYNCDGRVEIAAGELHVVYSSVTFTATKPFVWWNVGTADHYPFGNQGMTRLTALP